MHKSLQQLSGFPSQVQGKFGNVSIFPVAALGKAEGRVFETYKQESLARLVTRALDFAVIQEDELYSDFVKIEL